MSDVKWVQHVSGQGEKWKVVENHGDNFWRCYNPQGCNEVRLPKSEYRPCDQPVRWRDVTEQCVLDHEQSIRHNGKVTVPVNGYRRRKVNIGQYSENKWAFIVEQREG